MKGVTKLWAEAKLLAAVSAVCSICACSGGKGGNANDGSLQITEDDIVQLDGSIFDTMIDSWEPVWLDDSEEALLGEVRYVAYDDGLFFVQSTSNYSESSVMVFDKEGHFRNRIGNIGNARNEYRYLQSLAIDPSHKEAVLLTGYPLTLKYFDYSGKFLRNIEVDTEGFDGGIYPNGASVCLPDGTLLVENMKGSEPNDDYILIHADCSVEALFERRGYKIKSTDNITGTFYVGMTHKIYEPHADVTWLMRSFDNHLYRMEGSDSASCVANLAYIEKIPEDVRCDYPALDFEDRREYCTLETAVELKDYIMLRYSGDGELYSYFYFEKETMRIYKGENDRITNLPPLYSPIGSIGNTVIGVVNTSIAETVYTNNKESDMDEGLKEFYRKVAVRDNPVLVLYRMKEPAILHKSIDNLN